MDPDVRLQVLPEPRARRALLKQAKFDLVVNIRPIMCLFDKVNHHLTSDLAREHSARVLCLPVVEGDEPDVLALIQAARGLQPGARVLVTGACLPGAAAIVLLWARGMTLEAAREHVRVLCPRANIDRALLSGLD